MIRNLQAVIWAAFSVALFCTTCHAIPLCPEGKTFTGTCVNVQLSQDLRKRIVVFTQPKISKTAPIFLPRRDRDFLLPQNSAGTVHRDFVLINRMKKGIAVGTSIIGRLPHRFVRADSRIRPSGV